MNLPVFFQTAATLSPILLAGTALALSAKSAPKTRVGSAVLALVVIGPPSFVTLYSLLVLAGFKSAETRRVPVLALLYVQFLTGIIGTGRPSTVSVWRIACALRPRGTLRDRVALDQRLRDAAGPSLRYSRTRPHVARERARAELLTEAAAGAACTEADAFGALVVAGLARAGHPVS